MILGMRTSVSTLAITAVISQSFLLGASDYSAVTPTSTNVSVSRAGNAMIYDSTGKLTYAPNNLLTYSNTFNAGTWAAVNSVRGANSLTDNATNGGHSVQFPTVGFTQGVRSFLYVEAQASSLSQIMVFSLNSEGKGVGFDLSNGTTFTPSGITLPASYGIINIGSGWYGCWISVTPTSTATSTTPGAIYCCSGGAYSYAGTGQTVNLRSASYSAVTYETTPRTSDQVITTTSAYYGPRLDYDPATLAFKGLLVEGSRTNSWYPSGSSSAMSVSNTTLTDNAISPDGTTNAATFAENASTATHWAYNNNLAGTLATGTTFAYSLHVKANTCSTIYLNIQASANNYITAVFDVGSANSSATQTSVGSSSGTIVSTTQTASGNGWYRITIVGSVTGSTTPALGMTNASTGNTFTTVGLISYAGTSRNMYVHGAQVEAGSFATSYIPTTTASVTRAAETMTLPSYASQLVVTTRIDEQTGATYYDNIAPGATFTPNNGWISSLRVYTGASAGTQAVPSWLDNSGTTGNRMLYDSTGKLTYAPNNMLTYSQDATNGAWSKSNVTVTGAAGSAPDGTTTAVLVTPAATNTTHRIAQSATTGFSVLYSLYVKANGYTKVGIWDSATTGAYASFDCSGSGSVLDSGLGGSSASILSVGNGWYRVSFKATVNGTNSFAVQVLPASYTTGTINVVWTADGTSGVYLWGAQLEPVTYQTAPGAYIPTTTAAVYQPRFDYDPSTLAAKGLLIEESRVNLLTYSGDITAANWIGSSGISFGTPTTAPDGSARLARIIESNTNVQHALISNSVAFSAGTYTVSIYAKAGERSILQLLVGGLVNATDFANFNLATGAIGSYSGNVPTITSVGNGVYRCVWSFTAAAASATVFALTQISTSAARYTAYLGDGTSGLYVWGAQLEAGSFATSYIPTVAASVTRVADVVKFGGAAFTSMQTATQGTIVSQYKLLALSTAATQEIYNIDSGSAANAIYIRANNAAGSMETVAYVGGASQGFLVWSGSVTTNVSRCAYGYALNNTGLSVNGDNAALDTTYTVPSGFTRATLGCRANSAAFLNGHIQSFAYYNQRLSDATLKTKSTVGAPL
jgi:hypothetical protein